MTRFADVAAGLCRLAALTLNWRPHEFWSATPAELLGCLPRAEPADQPPTRTEIAKLMEQDHG